MRREAVFFAIVGATTFVFYFALQYAFEKLGAAPLAALSLAYAIAITFHYLSNKHFTFARGLKGQSNLASLPKYAAVNVVNYLITLAVVQSARTFGLDTRLGMIAAICVTTVSGFFLYRLWVFNGGKGASSQ